MSAFERAAQANPGASTLYRLGTLARQKRRPCQGPRGVRERARPQNGSRRGQQRSLCIAGARGRSRRRDRPRFGRRLASIPRVSGRVEHLGYALLLTGRDQDARALYERALGAATRLPEALNNLGLLLGRAGDLDGAARYFRDALGRRADYGEAANNLALILASRGQTDEAVALLQRLLQQTPEYEAAYVTWPGSISALISKEGIASLERCCSGPESCRRS